MSPTFAELGVPTHLAERLKARGITDAFDIQAAAIPDALQGRDVVGQARTGSGKTLAFGLPLLARLTRARAGAPTALVITPTRELAAQVTKELAGLSDDGGKRVLSVYGGTSYQVARTAFRRGVDVVVACPGRLEDLIEQGTVNLASVTTVVVDEADRMADMGFLPAVRRLISQTDPERHVMLFSATLGDDVRRLISEFTHDAVVHDVVGEQEPSDIDHFFWRVDRENRLEHLLEIADSHDRAIVFTRTKHAADRLARQLDERGVSAVALHGDRSQAQRDRALRSVREGRTRILVATDVAARGIHIDDLPAVVHYDLPQASADYVHRSGRTGRAGASGVVISLVTSDRMGLMKQIQRELHFEPGAELPDLAVARRPLHNGEATTSADLTSPAPRRGRAEGPRDARPDSVRADRPGRRESTDRTREFAREDRPVRRERSFERPERSPARPERSEGRRDRFEGRSERGPRSEGRYERTERTPRHDARFSPREREGSRSTSRESSRRATTATVSFFNEHKGFGFASDAKGDDLFIHFSNIAGEGFKTLKAGQTISFNEFVGPKGREARDVRVLERRDGSFRRG